MGNVLFTCKYIILNDNRACEWNRDCLCKVEFVNHNPKFPVSNLEYFIHFLRFLKLKLSGKILNLFAVLKMQ